MTASSHSSRDFRSQRMRKYAIGREGGGPEFSQGRIFPLEFVRSRGNSASVCSAKSAQAIRQPPRTSFSVSVIQQGVFHQPDDAAIPGIVGSHPKLGLLLEDHAAVFGVADLKTHSIFSPA